MLLLLFGFWFVFLLGYFFKKRKKEKGEELKILKRYVLASSYANEPGLKFPLQLLSR